MSDAREAEEVRNDAGIEGEGARAWIWGLHRSTLPGHSDELFSFNQQQHPSAVSEQVSG